MIYYIINTYIIFSIIYINLFFDKNFFFYIFTKIYFLYFIINFFYHYNLFF